jgi:hypothetical protein
MAIRRQMNWGNLADKLENATKGKAKPVDARFYQPKFDKDGSAQAIIRFLPCIETEDLPIVTTFAHKFRGPGGYYNEQCPTTIATGDDICPVCNNNRKMWSVDEKLVSKRARKTKFISNILVITDPATPENEGKVFLLKYDKNMFKKIMLKVKPKVGGIDKPCNVFDYEEGANLRLIGAQKTITVDGKQITFPDFDSSSFAEPTPLKAAVADSADQNLFPLADFLKPELFKTYEELEQIFNRVIGGQQNAVAFSAPQKSNKNSIADFSADLSDDEVTSETFDTVAPTSPIADIVANDKPIDISEDPDDFLAKMRNRKAKK